MNSNNGYFAFNHLKQFEKFHEMNEFFTNTTSDSLVFTGFAINPSHIITTFSNLKYAVKNIEIFSNNVQFKDEIITGLIAGCDIENNLMILRLDTDLKIQNIPYGFNFDIEIGQDLLIIGNDENNIHTLNLLKTSVVAEDEKQFHMDITLLSSIIGSPIVSLSDVLIAGIVTSSITENNFYSTALKSKQIKNLCEKYNIEINNKSELKKNQEASYYYDNMLGNIFYIRIPDPLKLTEYNYLDDNLFV